MHKIFTIVLTLLFIELHAQRIIEYDSISTSQQDYPCVTQTLDDGTLLMAAVTRPWLWNGKGNLILVRMNMNGIPMYNKITEINDISINNIGGIFKTGDNQYTIFCIFDTTGPNFNNRPTHFGYLHTDTLLNISFSNIIPIPSRPNATTTGIFDVKVKNISKSNFIARLGINDDAPGYRAPYTYNVIIELDTYKVEFLPDTNRKVRNFWGNVQSLSYTSIIPMDFLLDTTLNIYFVLDKWAFSTGNSFSCLFYTDSIYVNIFSHEAINKQDTLEVMSYRFHRMWRTNMMLYKKRFILMGGTGVCRDNFDLIDTLYRYEPGQSGLTLLSIDTSLIKNEYNNIFNYPTPYRFNFVEDIRSAFSDTLVPGEESLFRIFGDYYSSAYMQCIDFLDENKIYYGRQLGDVVNLQLPYSSYPSLLLISQFDSTLNKTWERRILARNREGIVSVNATHDGGVILTTRSSTGPINDPQFSGSVHTFDIAVYKLNQHGVITSYKKVQTPKIIQSFTLYPNPAKDYVKINGDSPIQAVQVWDSQGKQYHTIFNTTTQEINTSHLPVGVYYIQLFNSQNEILQVLKLVKE